MNTQSNGTNGNGDSEEWGLGSKQVHPIICNYTGLTVGAINVLKVAGHVPYLSQWKHTQALHPLFSLEQTALLNFSRSIWNHFCSLTPEEAANPALTDKQELLLRVAALAMVHQLSDVTQDFPWMPTLAEVSGNWNSLLQLSYWKNYLESQRFRFPAVRISRFNKGIDLYGYIQDCWLVKKEYESRVREAVEREKLESAEKALKILRDDLAGKAPRSKKILWRWFCAHLPAKYSKDLESWMWELFDAETEQEVSEFTIADIDLFEQIVLAEVELGSAVSHAFLERLAHKRELLTTKFKTFEILIPEAITAGVADGSIGVEEPRADQFASRTKFIIAHAKWKLAHTDTTKYRAAAEKQQQEVTVKASYVPDISDYLSGRDLEPDEDTGPLFDATEKLRDNPISDGGEIEE